MSLVRCLCLADVFASLLQARTCTLKGIDFEAIPTLSLHSRAQAKFSPYRSLRDIFTGLHHLKVQNTKQKPAGLLPVTESPAGRSPEPSTGGGTAGAAVGMQAGRPSPLGRNVVTALEAELDQVLAIESGNSLPYL